MPYSCSIPVITKYLASRSVTSATRKPCSWSDTNTNPRCSDLFGKSFWRHRTFAPKYFSDETFFWLKISLSLSLSHSLTLTHNLSSVLDSSPFKEIPWDDFNSIKDPKIVKAENICWMKNGKKFKPGKKIQAGTRLYPILILQNRFKNYVIGESSHVICISLSKY